ncbi:MAG: S8 family peptidase [Duganella sp.]
MKLRPVSAAVALLLSSLCGLAAQAHADDIRRPYIVQLADKPVSSYTGGVNNIPATKPAKGLRLDLNTAAAQSYSRALVQKQQSVKNIIPAAPILHEYKVVLNGFAAMLTDAEVRALKANTNVAAISADTPRQPLTSFTPTFLGLDGPGGLWQQLGGKDKAGEDVVIGVIDTGIWPESPSFADRVDSNGKPTFDNSGTLAYNAPVGWQGTCETGEGFTVAHCNNKLIGARYFIDGFRAAAVGVHWSEFISPRDSIGGPVGSGGHGTHTASTAGGNNGVAATIGDNVALGAISGMAPRARIAAYKICWTFPDSNAPAGGNGCWGTDAAAAIEQAVIDGVDVLNYSISGGTTPDDPVEQAFLHASNAGVFVAAAGGNDGPANAVNHNSPWLTTVAAASHARLLRATVTLGNGASYQGASLNNHALPASTPIVRGLDARAANADADAARLCFSSVAAGGPGLDPAKVAGKIVTCVRGTNDRVDKSLAVKQAGGVGMIMIDDGNGLVAEIHSVPTVHVSAADGAAIQAYAAAAAPKAALSVFRSDVSTNAPMIAAFSSRGPNSIDADQLKPDLAAPGVEILAGVTPALTPEQRDNIVNGTFRPAPAWAFYQGTSMATPHVAGVAALLHQQHPTWSPAAIKSALMTTATPTFKDAQGGDLRGAAPFGQGAGHINMTGSMVHPADGKAYNRGGAADPGLVYDAGATDYKRYLCGAGVASECGDGTLVSYNLNLPSISLGSVAGTVEVKRTVTNVGASEATYTGSITLPGYSAVLSPTSLKLAPGASASYTVRVTRTTAPNAEWQYGDVTWTDGAHVVRAPLTARNVRQLSAPEIVTSTRASSAMLLTVLPGFTGRLGTVAAGFKEVTIGPLETVGKAQIALGGDVVAASVAACRANAPGTKLIPMTVPADTITAVFETFDRDTGSKGGDDIDMVVLNPNDGMAAYSLRTFANEQVVLNSPSPGTYRVCVIGFAPANDVSTEFRLSSAIVTRGDTLGNLKVGAGRVTAGTVATLTASWSGLPAGKRYFGGVQYLDPAGLIATSTALQVETNDPVPLARGGSHASRVIGTK